MAIKIFHDSYLEPYEYAALQSMMTLETHPKGYVLAEEGKEIEPAIYLISSGAVSISAGNFMFGKSTPIKTNGYFGDENINPNDDSPKVISKQTITVTEDCTLRVLTRSAIEMAIGDMTLLSTKKSSSERATSYLDTAIQLSDLEKYRVLGCGTFGQVWLVARKGTKDAYALKVQNKKELLSMHQARGVIREKNIMASINYPFIIKLVNAFQDSRNVYMVLELVQGGELLSIMHNADTDTIPESNAKFYAGTVLLGLSYMHRRHILYRDLKPENVMMDNDGYTVLVDLGFAKVVPEKTFTLCGTPLYIAPEVVQNRGHDKGADHWSFGALIYEMILGYTPFFKFHEEIDQITLFKRIVKGRMYPFPKDKDTISDKARDLIKRLLIVTPTQRLGSFARGDMDIREHPWLNPDIDFKALAKREVTAPWVPTISDPLDDSNFYPWKYKDEKDPKPPGPKGQAKFKDF